MSDETVSGGVPPGLNYTVQSISAGRDIFKDNQLAARMALQDLAEAIAPPACPECGHRKERVLGQVEHYLYDVQQILLEQLPGDRWVRTFFLLLYNLREELSEDWVEGLREDARLGWAGETLKQLQAGDVLRAQRILEGACRCS